MGEAVTVRLDRIVTMRTIEDALARRLPESDFTVDMGHVEEADSGAIALLLDWMRRARAAGHAMAIRDMPPGLRSLAELYGVDELLPLAA